MATTAPTALRVFCSYSREDETYLNELKSRLTELEHQDLIEVWTDRAIVAGQEWEEVIQDNLARADIYLLLVSPAFMSSDYAYEKEMSRAIDRNRRGEALVIPIIVRPALWEDSLLGRLQALPRDAKPISTWSNPDEAWADVLTGIRRAVAELRRRRSAPSPVPPSDEKRAEETSEEEAVRRPQSPQRQRLDVAARALSDGWSKYDQLGFLDYAIALSDFIKDPRTEKPLTIGIDAPWGMGKTTLMRLIQHRLDSKRPSAEPPDEITAMDRIQRWLPWNRPRDESLPTVWFNAWKHDEEESVWAALALEILDQTRKEISLPRRVKLWVDLNRKRLDTTRLALRLLGSLLVVFVLLLAITLTIIMLWAGGLLQGVTQRAWQYIGLIGGLGVVASLYNTIVKDIYRRITSPFNLKITEYISAPDYNAKAGFLSQFQEDFKRVIDSVTDKSDRMPDSSDNTPDDRRRPLVVFIDDLDRATPSKAVEIIEAISVLLDAEHCVFVIGMDSEMVASSIETKYKDLKDYLGDAGSGLTLGRHFLEKIVQIPFRIPRPDKGSLSTFIDKNLEGDVEVAIETARPIGTEAAAASPVSSMDSSLSRQELDTAAEVEREKRATSFGDSKEVRQAISAAAPYLGYNPRKVKRFINLFKLQALIANRRGLLEDQTIELDYLAKWLTIRMCWPAVIDGVTDDRDFPNHVVGAHTLHFRLLNLYEELEERDAKVSSQEAEEARSMLEGKLEPLLAKPRVKQFYRDSELVYLLRDTSDSNSDALPYLYLTGVTASSAIPSEPQGQVTQLQRTSRPMVEKGAPTTS